MTCIDYFYRILAKKDYSAHELLKKAKEKGFEQSEITNAIQELQLKGYQSDARLVESMITSAQGKYGRSVVKRKCFVKGISGDLFEEIWESQTESEELEQLLELKLKVMRKYKISDFHEIEPKTKARLWNYLQYRGFNPNQILEQWKNEDFE